MERSAVQNDVGFDAHAARPLGRNEGCATSGAAGHSDAATPFPNPHADLGGRHYLRKLDVAAVGELLVDFQDASPFFKLDFFDIVDEDDRVRIAHRYGFGGKVVAVGGELDRPEEIAGQAHIYADAAVVEERGLHESALGM